MTRAGHNWEQMYASGIAPPWEIGQVQPALLALTDELDIEGLVLDVGCGTGDFAIYLAERGHTVIGIDVSPTGIAQARLKAAKRGVEIAFEVADAIDLQALGIRPNFTFSSGLLHNLDNEEADAYVAGLAAICDPGAVVCVLAVSAESGMGFGVTSDQLVGLFSDRTWTVPVIKSTTMLANIEGDVTQIPSLLLTSGRSATQ